MSKKVSLIATDDPVDGDSDGEEDYEVVRKGENEKNEKSADSWTIDTIPTEFESLSVPSQVVQNLLDKKRDSHEKNLYEMHQELMTIQEKCQHKFETLGDNLKSAIDEIRQEIHNIQETFETDINRFNSAERQKINDRLTSLLESEESLITEFHKEMCKNEMKRTASVRKTFKKYRKKLINIAHVPPQCLDIPTDEEIENCNEKIQKNEIIFFFQNYNEKIQKNYSIYKKLCLKLHSNTSDLKSELYDWLEEIKIFRMNKP